MSGLTQTELARELGYAKSTLSGLVSEGKLDGSFRLVGKRRVFDLAKAAAALNRRLDVGQQTGNGARHLEHRARLGDGPAPIEDLASDSDARRLARARADAAEMQARQKRREEMLETGRYVLAEDVGRATSRAVSRTLDACERILVSEAKRIAREHGGDALAAAAEVRRRWREHRAEQAQALSALAHEAGPTEAEIAEMAEA